MSVDIRIPLRSGSIEGCWYGKSRERPILALHGWQDNSGSFALLAPLLSQHIAILAIDLPGHGRSRHNPPGITYHTSDYARIIKEIILYYKWPKVSLMGHSMGAAVSYYFTALFPELVDVLISIDVMHTRYFMPDIEIHILRYTLEKFLIATDRKLDYRSKAIEPPTYTFERLEELLHEASENSVDLDKTKYILERNITALEAAGNGNKFYFSRDEGIKSVREYTTEPGLCLEMARKMTNIKWLVLKAGDSYHINENLPMTINILDFLKKNNPNFRYQVIAGAKHHCHLNNANVVAQHILPFLQKHRPPVPFDLGEVTHEVMCNL